MSYVGDIDFLELADYLNEEKKIRKTCLVCTINNVLRSDQIHIFVDKHTYRKGELCD